MLLCSVITKHNYCYSFLELEHHNHNAQLTGINCGLWIQSIIYDECVRERDKENREERNAQERERERGREREREREREPRWSLD